MKQKRAKKLFCYYCDREFNHENFLVEHQRAKHFKCLACPKNFSMAEGLVDHMLCVHKETITEVPNAMPGRESTMMAIYGMHGIPPDVLEAHNFGKDEDPSAKQAKVEMPGALNSDFSPPPYDVPPRWQVPPRPQTWYPQLPVRTTFVPNGPAQQQARFPIQNFPSPQVPYYAPGFEPSFPTVPMSPAPYGRAQPKTFFPPTRLAQPHARFTIQNVPTQIPNIAPGFEPSFPTVPMSSVPHGQAQPQTFFPPTGLAQPHTRFPIQNVPSGWKPDIAPGFEPSFPKVQMSPAPYGQAQPQAFSPPTRLAQPHPRFPIQNVSSLKPDFAPGFEPLVHDSLPKMSSPTSHSEAHPIFPSNSSSNAPAHNPQILATTAPSVIPARSATVLNNAVGQTPMSNIAMGRSYYTPSKGNPANSNSPVYASDPKIEGPSVEPEPQPVISNQDPVAQLEVNETFSSINLGGPTNINSHMYASGSNIEAPSNGPPPLITNQAPAAELEYIEVYFIWEDDDISMEERRLSLPKYQEV